MYKSFIMSISLPYKLNAFTSSSIFSENHTMFTSSKPIKSTSASSTSKSLNPSSYNALAISNIHNLTSKASYAVSTFSSTPK